MPYIERRYRESLDPHILELVGVFRSTLGGRSQVGVLNYIITELILHCMQDENYAKINSVIGMLECIKMEYSRRVLFSYEDRKIKENGDLPFFPTVEDHSFQD